MTQLPAIDNERLKEILEGWGSNLFVTAMEEFNIGLHETLDTLITWAINAKQTIEAAMKHIPCDDDETVVVLRGDLLVCFAQQSEWQNRQNVKLDYRSLSMALAGLDALEEMDETDLSRLTNLEDIDIQPGDFAKTRELLKAMFSRDGSAILPQGESK